MTVELTPNGTHGAGRPRMPRPLARGMQGIMVWFARHTKNNLVVITTTGARSGRPHTVSLGRFPDGENTFLVVASNGGSSRHPAWYINMVKNPDKVWAEVAGKKVKVRPQMLKGAEREAAMQRVIAASPGYARYQRITDREIPVIRLVSEAK